MKQRTTIYLSDGARQAIKNANLNLSAYIEEKIFDDFGFSQSRRELEGEIEMTERKLKELQTKLEGFDDQEILLDAYCKIISDTMDRKGCSCATAMNIMRIHSKGLPMCNMSGPQLAEAVENYRKVYNQGRIYPDR